MSFAPRRALLLMDNRSDSNWGSKATTGELVKALERTYPGIEIRGIHRKSAGRPKWKRSVGYRLAPTGPTSDWKNRIALFGVRLLTDGWRDAIDWADLIVVNGEGTLHPQAQTLAWMPVIDWVRRNAKAPLWVVNCTIELCDEQTELFESVLSKIERIVVREPLSFELCKSRDWNVVQGADCAFMAPTTDAAELLNEKNVKSPYAVFTGSAVGTSWNDDNIRAWIAAIRSRGLEVVWTGSALTDRTMQARIDPNGIAFTHETIDYTQLLGLIDRAALHFGGRYHPTIFAAMKGTPCIALESNSYKMAGVMKLLELDNPIYAPTQSERIIDAIQTIEIETKDKDLVKRCQTLSVQAMRNVRTDVDS